MTDTIRRLGFFPQGATWAPRPPGRRGKPEGGEQEEDDEEGEEGARSIVMPSARSVRKHALVKGCVCACVHACACARACLCASMRACACSGGGGGGTPLHHSRQAGQDGVAHRSGGGGARRRGRRGRRPASALPHTALTSSCVGHTALMLTLCSPLVNCRGLRPLKSAPAPTARRAVPTSMQRFSACCCRRATAGAIRYAPMCNHAGPRRPGSRWTALQMRAPWSLPTSGPGAATRRSARGAAAQCRGAALARTMTTRTWTTGSRYDRACGCAASQLTTTMNSQAAGCRHCPLLQRMPSHHPPTHHVAHRRSCRPQMQSSKAAADWGPYEEAARYPGALEEFLRSVGWMITQQVGWLTGWLVVPSG